MRYQYKLQKTLYGGSPVWKAYFRICWPLPWHYVDNSLSYHQDLATAECHKHAAKNERSPKRIYLGRLPLTAEESGF